MSGNPVLNQRQMPNDADDWAGRLNLAASKVVERIQEAAKRNPNLKHDIQVIKEYIKNVIDYIRQGGKGEIPPPNTNNPKLISLVTEMVKVTEHDMPSGTKVGAHGSHGSSHGSHHGSSHGSHHGSHGSSHGSHHGGYDHGNYGYGYDNYGYGFNNWLYPMYGYPYNNYWWYSNPMWWNTWDNYLTPYYYWNDPYATYGYQYVGAAQPKCSCSV